MFNEAIASLSLVYFSFDHRTIILTSRRFAIRAEIHALIRREEFQEMRARKPAACG